MERASKSAVSIGAVDDLLAACKDSAGRSLIDAQVVALLVA
jgi:hypothetical protein